MTMRPAVGGCEGSALRGRWDVYRVGDEYAFECVASFVDVWLLGDDARQIRGSDRSLTTAMVRILPLTWGDAVPPQGLEP